MMNAKMGQSEILNSDKYIFEPKLNGYRVLCEIKGGKIKFISRNGRDVTHEFSDIKFNTAKNCIVDGEIVSYDENGNSSFSLMRKGAGAMNYVIFDILEVEGINVKSLPLMQRKELLKVIVEENKLVQIIPYFTDGLELWDVVVSRNMDGVVAKKIDDKYVNGENNSWVKIKNELIVDCIILGYVLKVKEIASLSLGLYKDGKIIYVGQVGAQFNKEFLKDLMLLFKPIEKSKLVKTDVELPKNVQRIEPKFVCEVKYLELTKDEKLRAIEFIRFREDKYPQDCTINQVKLNA